MTTPSRRDLANAIRFLAIDAVQAANSGRPGMPMGMADIAEVLWNDYLGHNPNNPKWFNRDRFMLSNGHGSMLQYALLHLSGYDLRSEEHTSELQSLMLISYAVFCLKKKNNNKPISEQHIQHINYPYCCSLN